MTHAPIIQNESSTITGPNVFSLRKGGLPWMQPSERCGERCSEWFSGEIILV